MPSLLGLAGVLGLSIAPVIAPAAEQPGTWQAQDGDVLGAPANFVVTAMDNADAQRAIVAARAEIHRLDQVFNSRREGAELLALNRASAMVASPELFEVLVLAEAMRVESDGAYDGRMGEVLRLWRQAGAAAPDAKTLRDAVALAQAPVGIDPQTRTILRPEGVFFALDGIAKGYIVDKALEAGLAAAPIKGMLVDIGGDMRCQGYAPGAATWDIGIPDPSAPFAGAPLVARAHLKDKAIATSGRGPRDRTIAGKTYSATVSPKTGWAVAENISATVVANTTAEADALATAILVMKPAAAMALVEGTHGAEARLTHADLSVHTTEGWSRWVSEPPARVIQIADTKTNADRWLADWTVQIVYTAPEKAVARRQKDFRTPYMAMWITDKQNRPVRTLVLVGKNEEWQRDNFIWWNMYKARAPKLVELRSTATALSGAYPTLWPGYNDDWTSVPRGDYILHIETSRERGQHTYRTVPLVIGKTGFSIKVTPTEEGGGLRLIYGAREQMTFNGND